MRTGRRVSGAAALAVTMVAVIQGVPVAVGQLDQWSARAAVAPWMLGQVVIVPGNCYDQIQSYLTCYSAALNCSRHGTQQDCEDAGTGYWLQECPHVWSVQALSQAIQRIRLDVVPNGCGYRQYGDCYWASGRCLNDWWYSVAPCNGVVHQEKPPTGEDPPCPDA